MPTLTPRLGRNAGSSAQRAQHAALGFQRRGRRNDRHREAEQQALGQETHQLRTVKYLDHDAHELPRAGVVEAVVGDVGEDHRDQAAERRERRHRQRGAGDARHQFGVQRIGGAVAVQLAVDREQRDLGADRGSRAQRDEQRGEHRHQFQHQQVQQQFQRIRRDAVLVRERRHDLDEEQAQQRRGRGVARQHLPGGEIDLPHGDFARARAVGRGRDRGDDGEPAELEHAPPAARAEQESAGETGVVHLGLRPLIRRESTCAATRRAVSRNAATTGELSARRRAIATRASGVASRSGR